MVTFLCCFINNCNFKCHGKGRIGLGITDVILDNLETLCAKQLLFLVTYRNKEAVRVPGGPNG